MSAPLTRSEAWELIAEAYAGFADEGGVDGKGLAQCGLCFAVRELEANGRISELTGIQMRATIERTLDEMGSVLAVYLGPYNREMAGERAMLATLFALEPEA